MIEDNPFRKLPHRCGAVTEYCLIDDERIIYFCSLCRLVVGYEANGIRIMKGEEFTDEQIKQASGYKKKELSDEAIEDLR